MALCRCCCCAGARTRSLARALPPAQRALAISHSLASFSLLSHQHSHQVSSLDPRQRVALAVSRPRQPALTPPCTQTPREGLAYFTRAVCRTRVVRIVRLVGFVWTVTNRTLGCKALSASAYSRTQPAQVSVTHRSAGRTGEQSLTAAGPTGERSLTDAGPTGERSVNEPTDSFSPALRDLADSRNPNHLSDTIGPFKSPNPMGVAGLTAANGADKRRPSLRAVRAPGKR
jgi:hypothetical protein